METILNKESRAAIELMVINGIITKDVAEKYFPELRESEDERTKRRIIEWVVQCKTEASDEERIKEYDSWIAWLKKQGSHQKFYDSIQIGDKVTRNEDGILVNLSLLNRVAKRVEPTYTKKDVDDAYLKGLEDAKSTEIKEDPCKDCYAKSLNCHNFPCETKKAFEQKLIKASYTTMVEIGNGSITSVIERDLSTDRGDGEQNLSDNSEPKFEVDSNEDGLIADTIRYKNEQKPAAWSEEDEELYKDTLDAIEAYYNDLGPVENLDGIYKWVKSLKDRIQPKQEWSEEDETRLTNIIIMLKEGASLHFAKNDITKTVNWLKSIKPQNRWKPSREQIGALEYYIHNFISDEDLFGNEIIELYEQLKKLKD